MIQNPTNPNDDFGEKMSSFCSTAERQLALLLKKKSKMVEEYENLAKWLIFDAKKMPSKELFALLSEVKNDLVNAEIQNKERVEKEAKLKLQVELRQQQLAKTAARRQNKIGKFFLTMNWRFFAPVFCQLARIVCLSVSTYGLKIYTFPLILRIKRTCH